MDMDSKETEYQVTKNDIERVMRLFIKELSINFGHPKYENDDELALFYSSLTRDIYMYSDDVLIKSSGYIRRTREKRTFPTVAECLKACQDVAVAMERVAADRKRRADARNDVWSQARRDNADRLFKTYAYETGRYGSKYTAKSAVRGGWAWGAWDFMREQERWPNKYEADDIIEKSKSYNRMFAETIRKNRFSRMTQGYARMRRYTAKRLRALAFNLEFSEELPQILP